MKTANKQIGIRVPKIPIVHLVATLEEERKPRGWLRTLLHFVQQVLLRSPHLVREQGPGLPALAEHEWRPARIEKAAELSRWNA